eukprot:TRINITY_DN34915_c0_g1_i1.p1 TRINITY_DN34915_c0_g1~~TRINITY_DN34915_c0_g1_i1.p1  ORF type:complete len:980 (+),score=244.38 TRINITY_DN34915_c0_g1_i1:104-3043(+)
MAAEAGVGAAAAAATGFGLWGYNRGNYLYDAEFRFDRMCAGREYACAQTDQYRDDLRALSALVAKKNGFYAVVATLDMALCIALYCAGRLGLHGPSPPGWLMGLWLTTNAASFAFMGLAILLALHASFRAQAATTHLLTRKVRLPVPTLKQLDKARRFSSEYEQANVSDMFRIPYLQDPGAPKTDQAAKRSASAGAGKSRKSKASSWIAEEFQDDRAGTLNAGSKVSNLPADVAPEHFRIYASLQKEWFQYDVYARVCMLLGFTAFVQSLAYYGLGHINVELRAFWVAHATVFCIECLHVLLLRFDLVSGRTRARDKLPFCQWLGPLSVFFATVGMSLDFRVQFNITAIVFTWICIFCAYICQFLYQLRLLELVLPDDMRNPLKLTEEIGNSWWPETWRVPSSFMHVLYVVVPPPKLQPGQNDIVREVKEGSMEPFETAGVAIGDNKDHPPGSPELKADIAAQVHYLDRLFDWVMQDRVFDSLTEKSQQEVKDLFGRYSDCRRSGTAEQAEASGIIPQCLAGIEGVIQAEGIGGSAGYSSGSDSSGYSSGSNSSGSDNDGPKSYSWDGRKVTFKPEKMIPVFKNSEAVQPWWMVSAIQVVVCGAWAFMIMAMIIDVFLGDQGLVTAPHWSRPPMSRQSRPGHEIGTPIGLPWPAGAKPWLPDQMAWHEEKRHWSMDTLGRRLSLTEEEHVASAVPTLRATFDDLMSTLPAPMNGHMSHGKAMPVSWPGFFEPHVMACGADGIAAITPRGVGAMVSHSIAQQAAQRFRLGGLTHLPPLLAAAMEKEHLNVVSRAGHIYHCPGPRPTTGGIWGCGPHPHVPSSRLPLAENAKLIAAAAAKLFGASKLHAAIVDHATPDLVALFVLEASQWLPLGEVPVPKVDGKRPSHVSVSFVNDGELLVTTGDGAVLRRRLQDGAVMASSSHPWGAFNGVSQWKGACGVPGGAEGRLAHLRLHRKEGSEAWHPEIVGDLMQEISEPLYQ